MLAHWTQRNTTYSGLQQYGIGQTDRETGPENERHRERAIERIRPIVIFALGKASGLRRGVQISPMLPIFASVSVSHSSPLPSLSFPCYRSLSPSREAFALLQVFGLRRPSPCQRLPGGIRLPSLPPTLPPSLPLASREASPL